MNDTSSSLPDPLPLLEDGSLVLSAAPETEAVVRAWLPRLAASAPADPARARIRVEAGAPPAGRDDAPPAMELYGVRGWGPVEGRVVLAGRHGRIGARIDLEARAATVVVKPEGEPPGQRDVFAAFTIAAALLLTRLRRALVHAAAVVEPGGGAWLLPGSSYSGKSTTCITLIRGGWNYLTDDHVVLGTGPGDELRAQGWARNFHLDTGYAQGASHGARARVEADAFGPGRWQSSAPLAGLLFPRVQPELPTALLPLHPAAALSLLLRQSPFVVNDPAAAPPVLALLQRAAALPAYELRLGSDSYCNEKQLQSVLRP
ncbi:MAG TPA: hypothetical protein VFS20_16965 [Longimicrobium sp.]|nr:hypothetical protein [Longimicrobium sp.]